MKAGNRPTKSKFVLMFRKLKRQVSLNHKIATSSK
jgi:hypothetical protein